MKVLTSKTLLFCMTILSANSVMAAGWLNSYLPRWVSTPIEWISGYASPFMPANKTDALKIKEPIEKDVSAAHALLRESEQIRENQTFPKIHALNEDLEWIDRTMRSNQAQHSAFLDQHEQNLIGLQNVQEHTSADLKVTAAQVMALSSQHVHATEAVESMRKSHDECHMQLAAGLASIQLAHEKDAAESAALIQKSCEVIDNFDKQTESSVRDTNQKCTRSAQLLSDLAATDAANSAKIDQIIQRMEGMSAALDRYRSRKIKKREQRKAQRANSGSSSALLTQASATVVDSLKRLNDI